MCINGKKQDHSFDTAVCKVGGIQLKLVKPNDNKSIFSKHLSRFREGLHHVCFSVSNLNLISEEIKSQGKGGTIWELVWSKICILFNQG